MSGDFCSQNTEVIDPTNYTNSYGTTSCLPNGGTGFSSSVVSANGLVNQSDLDTYVVQLLTNAGANPPATITENDINPASEFSVHAAALRTSINNEYCFYYKRYIYVLEKVLSLAATTGVNVAAGSTYDTFKQNAIRINTQLNQILQIIQGVIKSRSDSLKSYYGTSTGVNALNTELDTARNNLIEHMGKLQDNDMENNVKSAMVDYTIEKNSSSRNLLAIYGFMNIVAVGLLFYIYRSSKV